MNSGLSVSGVFEVVVAFFGGVGSEQLADGGDDGLEGSRRRFAQGMFELGEDLLEPFHKFDDLPCLKIGDRRLVTSNS